MLCFQPRKWTWKLKTQTVHRTFPDIEHVFPLAPCLLLPTAPTRIRCSLLRFLRFFSASKSVSLPTWFPPCSWHGYGVIALFSTSSPTALSRHCEDCALRSWNAARVRWIGTNLIAALTVTLVGADGPILFVPAHHAIETSCGLHPTVAHLQTPNDHIKTDRIEENGEPSGGD